MNIMSTLPAPSLISVYIFLHFSSSWPLLSSLMIILTCNEWTHIRNIYVCICILLNPFSVSCTCLCLWLNTWNWINYKGLVPGENEILLYQQPLIVNGCSFRGKKLWHSSNLHWQDTWCSHYASLAFLGDYTIEVIWIQLHYFI